MSAYYNENDPKAAATLRELIREGLIAPGDVDERSIEDVIPNDVRGYTQCHFFAGFGIWSYAARRAGWPDTRPVWTGSCPCQPFSQAGKGAGFADERHLWPAFFHLIQHGKPADVPLFGEQVASKDGLSWIDLVQADMEAAGHSVWAFDLCAAGFGAPIIRQRFFWVARAERSERWSELEENGYAYGRNGSGGGSYAGGMEISRYGGCSATSGPTCGVGGTIIAGLAQRIGDGGVSCGPFGTYEREAPERASVHTSGVDISAGPRFDGQERDAEGDPRDEARVCMPGSGREARGMECSEGNGRIERGAESSERSTAGGCAPSRMDVPNGGRREIESLHVRQARQDEATIEPCGGSEGSGRTGPVNGFWRASDWLLCRDDKWRPVEPRTFPLAHGYPERVGILRGAGNAINAEVAKAFIEAYLEVENGLQ